MSSEQENNLGLCKSEQTIEYQKPAVKKWRCIRVLQMQHFEYIDKKMGKNDKLCAIGKCFFLFD